LHAAGERLACFNPGFLHFGHLRSDAVSKLHGAFRNTGLFTDLSASLGIHFRGRATGKEKYSSEQ
jgi:hypothetical protein